MLHVLHSSASSGAQKSATIPAKLGMRTWTRQCIGGLVQTELSKSQTAFVTVPLKDVWGEQQGAGHGFHSSYSVHFGQFEVLYVWLDGCEM
jgi:hypothetical protein